MDHGEWGSDKENDLAIVKIEDSKFTSFGNIPYSIQTAAAEIGEDIFVLGYPMTDVMGEEIKLTTGVVNSCSGYKGDNRSYQISAPIQPGNSGGPLFDSNGDVVGIVNAKHRQADNASYAIKSPYMRLFIQNGVGAGIIPTNRKMVGWSLTNKVKAIKPFVFIIYASTEATANPYATPQSQQKPQTPQTPPQPQVREYRAGDTYKIGDIIRINGAEGVVFEVADGGKHGKVISVREAENLNWASNDSDGQLIDANNEHNGAYNMAIVKQIPGWRNKYPAFRWCADMGDGWYLPAKMELMEMIKNRAIVNNALKSINAGFPDSGVHWSSTEQGEYLVWGAYASGTNIFSKYPSVLPRDSSGFYVRAVSAF